MEELDYSEHRPQLSPGEAVLWHGKPKRSAFIASKSLTMLPIAIVWLCFDSALISQILQGGSQLLFLIPFTLVHLFPVWIWLGSTLTASRRWKNTNYYVTNRRIILQGGFLAVNETSLFYKDMTNAHVNIDLLGKLFHTGNILFNTGAYIGNRNSREHLPRLEHLEDPHDVYNRIQKIIMDIQTDIEYPNAYRPAENPGYRTDYNP